MGTPLGQEDTGNHLQLLQLPQGTAHFASAVFHWQKTHRVPTPGFKGWDVRGSRAGTLTSSNKMAETWAGAGAVWPPVTDTGYVLSLLLALDANISFLVKMEKADIAYLV